MGKPLMMDARAEALAGIIMMWHRYGPFNNTGAVGLASDLDCSTSISELVTYVDPLVAELSHFEAGEADYWEILRHAQNGNMPLLCMGIYTPVRVDGTRAVFQVTKFGIQLLAARAIAYHALGYDWSDSKDKTDATN